MHLVFSSGRYFASSKTKQANKTKALTNNQKTGVICFTLSWLYTVSFVSCLPFLLSYPASMALSSALFSQRITEQIQWVIMCLNDGKTF